MRHALWSAAIAVIACASASGQGGKLSFEVASVKPSPPLPPGGRGVYFGPPRGGPGTPDPGQIAWSYATLSNLLMTAYGVKAYQLHGPVWLRIERYDIVAKVPAGATKEDVNGMWQNLLADRFGVTLHRESQPFQVDELVVARGGPKLKEVAEDPAALLLPGPPKLEKNGDLSGPGLITTISMGPHGASAHTVARAQPVSKLTEMLGGTLQHPVLDKTGLTGRYDFKLEFSPEVRGLALPPPPAGPPGELAGEPGPTLAEAVRQQLGLTLVPAKATLDVLVIDKAEKVPTEN